MYRGWGGLHLILYSLGVHLLMTSLQGTPEALLSKIIQQQYYKRMPMRKCWLVMITHFLLAPKFQKACMVKKQCYTQFKRISVVLQQRHMHNQLLMSVPRQQLYPPAAIAPSFPNNEIQDAAGHVDNLLQRLAVQELVHAGQSARGCLRICLLRILGNLHRSAQFAVHLRASHCIFEWEAHFTATTLLMQVALPFEAWYGNAKLSGHILLSKSRAQRRRQLTL